MEDLTLAEIIQLNAGQGHIERAQAEVRPGALPQPPSRDDDGADLGVCRVAGLQLALWEDPSRRQADVTVATVANSETYALDVGSSTVTGGSDASAEAHEIIDALFQAVAQQTPVWARRAKHSSFCRSCHHDPPKPSLPSYERQIGAPSRLLM